MLNYHNTSRGDPGEQVGLPGDYSIDAKRVITYLPSREASHFFSSSDRVQVNKQLRLHVSDSSEVDPAVYAPYVAELSSKDEQIRQDAARTLATLAPPSLEPLLTTFATSDDRSISEFAPLALSNLSTKASLSVLAQILVNKEPGTYEFLTAAELLGKTHDPAWFPVLLAIADQHRMHLLPYAAESGGESAVPVILGRIRKSGTSGLYEEIEALGRTGSRTAIPVLIDLLLPRAGEEPNVFRERAIDVNAALAQLTHVEAERKIDDDPTADWHHRWLKWWLQNGSSATLYRPEDCAAYAHLP